MHRQRTGHYFEERHHVKLIKIMTSPEDREDYVHVIHNYKGRKLTQILIV